jgi:transposase
MTKTQVEVITSVQRRRRWSRAEKERIVAVALEPGVVASEVAREAGIHASQLFRWRQELCKRTAAPVAFNPVAIAPVPEAFAASSAHRAHRVLRHLGAGERASSLGNPSRGMLRISSMPSTATSNSQACRNTRRTEACSDFGKRSVMLRALWI